MVMQKYEEGFKTLLFRENSQPSYSYKFEKRD